MFIPKYRNCVHYEKFGQVFQLAIRKKNKCESKSALGDGSFYLTWATSNDYTVINLFPGLRDKRIYSSG
jgi:hypothetical protein